ncbi:wall-associated receptor kinase-like 14 isoform X2 [Magnolia sinica]|uniref:wall-associated receptor kinase-like 14 isoform X2 n=1 Tax=Magnolia sinica TaxID=86752 RepID=UPI002657E5B7|nr:wall-associated receptor kinase-like 14 isoform X2 [Magnolia sinica]
MTFPPLRLCLFAILVLPIVAAQRPSACNRSCGGVPPVPYPFGFSDGCQIRLTCTHGEIHVGDFRVRNVTPEALLLDLPAKCGRPITTVRDLFGQNYAPTWRNGLLLQNCSSVVSGCAIPIALLDRRLDYLNCSSRNESVSCYSKDARDFMEFDISESGCQYLFSSVAVDIRNDTAVSLDFQTVELGWWMDGECGGSNECSKNASCQNLTTPTDKGKGFRCRCDEGFEGDGFVGGDGCHRVSVRCSPSRYMSGHCGKNRVGVLVGGILTGGTIMAGLAVLCCYIRRRSLSMRSQNSTRRLLSEAAGSCTVPFYPYREIERATNGFSEKQRLGTGAYGTVYAGKLHNDELVAVKKIRHRDTDGINQVMNEIKLLSTVSHPNLVRLLGCCIERGEQILVYEFMPNGTLSEHLQRERGPGLPWTVRLTIATETAKAIAHMHTAMNPPIYHRDIKSSNILLDFNFNSKVADFGLSRLGMTESSHISTAPQGTPGYLDPQYHQNFHLSDKSDVYSFGVVLVEIITALKVVDFSRVHTEVNLAALAIDKIGKGCIDEIIDPFLEPHRDAWTLSSIHKVAEVAFRCLAFHRDMRPSMMEVAAELDYIRLSGWAQGEENVCDASSVSSFSSPSHNSINSRTMSKKTASMGSKRLVVPQRSECVLSMELATGCSPVSVQDPWFSEQSSPSSNSLLGNVVQ